MSSSLRTLRRSPHARAGAIALGVLLAVASGLPAAAHDFWVQPASFHLAPGAATPVTLRVGHGPFRQRSPIPLGRISRFGALGPGGSQADLRGVLRLGGADSDGAVSFATPGAYVLALETDNRAQSRLPSIRYNDYLKAEGLTPALALRERTHSMGVDGRESYGRRAKVLLQVGPRDGKPQPQVTVPLGLDLEIVPERDPYAASADGALPVRVIYEGRPLQGALVKLTNLEHDAAPLETHVTDGSGRATFQLPRSGSWLLNVIWTKPVTGVAEVDFDTVFSSLSFGFSAL